MRRFLDLLAIDVLTLLLVFVVLVPQVFFLREVLGFLFIFFFPGYVLTAAIFPGQKSLSTTTRLAVSLALSITVAVFIGLVLSVTTWGFEFNSILVILSIFTLATSGLACYLRNRHRRGNKSVSRLRSFFLEAIQSFRSADWGYRSLVIFLLCVIIGGLGSLGYVMVRPLSAQPFSEFYILGVGSNAEGYPRELNIGEEGRIIIGIVNHENQETSYRVQIKADGIQLCDLSSITLNQDEKWQKELGFKLQTAGENQKVEFLLYKDAGIPYETRYIWVNVK